MKKTLLSIASLIMLALLPLQTKAETMTVHYLVLNQSDGTEVKFALTDYPVLTFNTDGELVVSCQDQEISFPVDALTQHEIISVEEEKPLPTGISTIDNGTANGRPTLHTGEAQFAGLRAGQRVQVFTADGKAVMAVEADAEGQVNLSLTSLPQGLYILRAPNYSMKVYKK